MSRHLAAALGLAAVPVLAGCGDPAPAPTPAPAPAPAAAGPRFEECAEAKGLRFKTNFLPLEQGLNFRINLYDHGCGVVVADFDGDGRDDAYLLNQLGANSLFRNKGDGSFEDVSKGSGTELEERICVAAAAADVDGDGDADLFVTTTRGGNALLLNEGGMKFRDATKEAGVDLVAESGSTAFFDADGDGDLDLFVSNTARWTLEIFDDERAGGVAGRDGDGRLRGHRRTVEAAPAAGLRGRRRQVRSVGATVLVAGEAGRVQ